MSEKCHECKRGRSCFEGCAHVVCPQRKTLTANYDTGVIDVENGVVITGHSHLFDNPEGDFPNVQD